MLWSMRFVRICGHPSVYYSTPSVLCRITQLSSSLNCVNPDVEVKEAVRVFMCNSPCLLLSLYFFFLYISPSLTALLPCYDSRVFLLSRQEEQRCNHWSWSKRKRLETDIDTDKKEDMLVFSVNMLLHCMWGFAFCGPARKSAPGTLSTSMTHKNGFTK